MHGHSLHLGHRLSQAASPAMQHAVQMLQMSSLEFAMCLQQALCSNPFLEEREPAPDEVAEDFGSELPGVGAAPPENDALSRAPMLTDLYDHLRMQIFSQPMSERERLAATLVINSLDEDGYLRDDPAPAAAECGFDSGELEQAIHRVQSCEPSGVAARSLQECLCLQLDTLDAAPELCELARAVILADLQALAQRDYASLSLRLAVEPAQIVEVHRLIRRLNPRPASRFANLRESYVEPDVIVGLNNGKLLARINPALMPRVSINRHYAALLRSPCMRGHESLRHQLVEARWLLRHARQRFDTLNRVSNAIIRRQPEFFTQGAAALKPMMLRDIADDLGLHLSTISRATANKYMATPRGVFEFKHFFSRALSTERSGPCSATAIKTAIREMIADESGAAQSDVTLARRLKEQGIHIARRTVTKYRNAMRIVPAEYRSELPA